MEDRLRHLAHWHARRREVDELLEPLLAHGPAAVDRVSARLTELTSALDAERAAWDAFSAACDLVAVDDVEHTHPVDEVTAARIRAERARATMTANVHPSVSDVLQHIDLRGPELRLLSTPSPRVTLDEGEPADT